MVSPSRMFYYIRREPCHNIHESRCLVRRSNYVRDDLQLTTFRVGYEPGTDRLGVGHAEGYLGELPAQTNFLK